MKKIILFWGFIAVFLVSCSDNDKKEQPLISTIRISGLADEYQQAFKYEDNNRVYEWEQFKNEEAEASLSRYYSVESSRIIVLESDGSNLFRVYSFGNNKCITSMQQGESLSALKNVCTFQYNARNELVKAVYADGTTTTWEWQEENIVRKEVAGASSQFSHTDLPYSQIGAVLNLAGTEDGMLMFYGYFGKKPRNLIKSVSGNTPASLTHEIDKDGFVHKVSLTKGENTAVYNIYFR